MAATARHLTPALTISIAVHGGMLLAILVLVRTAQVISEPPIASPREIVWLPDVRPPALGGGQPRAVLRPAPAPVQEITAPQPIPIAEPPSIVPASDAVPDFAPAPPAPGIPAGESTRGGPGTGGAGPGSGDQAGLGSPMGTIYGVGNGVSSPIALRRPPPVYTQEAVAARREGVVVLSCVVLPDGTCADIKVTKPLGLGLDEKAIESARRWQFRPGMRNGQPVPVRVNLEIEFSIR